MDESLYDAAGGRDVLVSLAGAWHRRCLDDPIVSHAFIHTDVHPDHVERLAAYWGEALGGPPDYSTSIADHSAVLRMHAGNGEHGELDERAVELFVLALGDADVPERVRPALEAWFRDAVAEMARFPRSAADVPAGLPFPRWSWDGPVT